MDEFLKKLNKDRLIKIEEELNILNLSMYNSDGSIKTMTEVLELLSESIQDVL